MVLGYSNRFMSFGIGTAWLPVCHLRGLAKSLPGCIAGIQGARQTFLSSCLIQLPSSLWPFLSALIPIRCADADWLGPLYSLDRGPYANHPTNCRSRDHDAHVLPGTALVRWYKLIVNFSWTGISLPRSCLHLLQSDDIAINYHINLACSYSGVNWGTFSWRFYKTVAIALLLPPKLTQTVAVVTLILQTGANEEFHDFTLFPSPGCTLYSLGIQDMYNSWTNAVVGSWPVLPM